jgi:hypothetical protein
VRQKVTYNGCTRSDCVWWDFVCSGWTETGPLITLQGCNPVIVKMALGFDPDANEPGCPCFVALADGEPFEDVLLRAGQ